MLVLGYTFKFFVIKKGVLRNFASVFYSKKKTLAQVFSCEFYKISKNPFSYITPPVAASAINKEIFGFLNVALAGLLNFSEFKKKMKN